MADLSKVKSGERIIDIKLPNGKFSGVKVSIRHIHDEEMKKIKRRLQDKKNHLEARGKNFKAEEMEENENSLLFEAMTGWIWGKDEDGDQARFGEEIPEFNRANVFRVFDACWWFRQGVDEEIGNTKAFFPD